LDRAFADFASWRLLTGARSDGAHFKDAKRYPGVEVNTTASLTSLPIADEHPDKKVARYGTSYVLFPVDESTPAAPIEFSFAGKAPFKWSAQLVCRKASGAAVVQPLVEGASEGKTTLNDPPQCAEIVLAVENLSEGKYDVNYDAAWNQSLWNPVGDYTYSVAALPPETGAGGGGGVAGGGGGTGGEAGGGAGGAASSGAHPTAGATGARDGAGCSCAAGGDERSALGTMATMLGVGLAGARRRRRRG
jgi:MYXO-CTERM domain-containing protein